MSKTAEAAPNEVASEVVDAPSASREIAPLAPIEKVKAGLAELKAKISSTKYDLTTGAGERVARQLRSQCVSIRTSVDEAYESVNRPMLKLQKDARALRDDIKAAVKLLEDPLDLEITALEEKKKAAALAKQEAEKVRIEAIQERIALIRRAADSAVGRSSAEIASTIGVVEKHDVSPAVFDEWASAAQRAKDETLDRLKTLHASAWKQEEQAEQLRKQAEELETLRRLQAERDAEEARQAAIEAAARAEAERVERERVAAEQKAEAQRLATERAAHEAQVRADREQQERIEAQAAAQRKAADDQARAERVEADRKAAAQRAEDDRIAREAREAEEARQAEARAELQRKQDEIYRAHREAREAQERMEAAELAEQQRIATELAERERVQAEERAAAEAYRKAAEPPPLQPAPATFTTPPALPEPVLAVVALPEGVQDPVGLINAPAGVYLPLTVQGLDHLSITPLQGGSTDETQAGVPSAKHIAGLAAMDAIALMLVRATAQSLLAEVVHSFGEFRSEGDDTETAALEALNEWDI